MNKDELQALRKLLADYRLRIKHIDYCPASVHFNYECSCGLRNLDETYKTLYKALISMSDSL